MQRAGQLGTVIIEVKGSRPRGNAHVIAQGEHILEHARISNCGPSLGVIHNLGNQFGLYAERIAVAAHKREPRRLDELKRAVGAGAVIDGMRHETALARDEREQ